MNFGKRATAHRSTKANFATLPGSYFSIGEYNSEMMQELAHQWTERLDDGEPLLVMMTSKTRWYQTDEGAVYTSLRPEEACVVNREVYANWLLDACEATMMRMNQFTSSLEVEPTLDAYGRAGLPTSLLAARNHYGEVDLEPFKLNLMQALDIAEGRIEAATTPPPMMSLPEGGDGDLEPTSGGDQDVQAFLLQAIGHLDQGEGMSLRYLAQERRSTRFCPRGCRGQLDDMLDAGALEEPRFGWFRLAAQ